MNKQFGNFTPMGLIGWQIAAKLHRTDNLVCKSGNQKYGAFVFHAWENFFRPETLRVGQGERLNEAYAGSAFHAAMQYFTKVRQSGLELGRVQFFIGNLGQFTLQELLVRCRRNLCQVSEQAVFIRTHIPHSVYLLGREFLSLNQRRFNGTRAKTGFHDVRKTRYFAPDCRSDLKMVGPFRR